MSNQVCVCFASYEDDRGTFVIGVFNRPSDADVFCDEYETAHPLCTSYFEFWDVQ